MSYPADENEFDKKAKDINIPSQYKNVDYGKKTKIVPRKVRLSYTDGSGKVYGFKSIMTKEDKLSFVGYLIQEEADLSGLPEAVFKEIKSLIRKGANDLEQHWRDALELVHRAYHVSRVRRPTPDQKSAWKQYEDLIKYGVQQLRATRGADGQWRITSTYIPESFEEENPIGKRRFFVEIPGSEPREVEAEDMDDIVDKITNKLRSQGAKLRVESRDKYTVVATVWVDGVLRERIVIKEL